MPKQQKILAMVDGNMLSEQDFNDAIQKVIDWLAKQQKLNKEELAKVGEMLAKQFLSLKAQIEATAKDNQGKLSQTEQDVLKRCDAKMAEMGAAMQARMMELKDGQDADEATMMGQLLDQMRSMHDEMMTELEQNIPQLGAPIRDALELLQNGEKLSIDAIEGLQEELDRLKKAGGSKQTFTGMNPYQPTTILAAAEAPDDSTVTFTFSQKPTIVVVNGANYREGHGWAYTNSQVVLDNPVGANGDIYAVI